MRRVLLYLLAFILAYAGVIHLIDPGFFLPAMPSYIPFHLEIVYLTGVIEIVLAIGLVITKYRSISAKLTALYFVAIIPAHLHVAINGIEMFGISHPAFLWGRLAFQGVFIWWALKMSPLESKKGQ